MKITSNFVKLNALKEAYLMNELEKTNYIQVA